MKIPRKIAVNLVVVLLLGVVTVGWVVTQLIGPGLVKTPISVTADFAQSGGVFTNQEVTYRGVLIGKVGDLELNEDGVEIELLIDPEWDGEIPADVEAKVQSKSAVGEQFVNLTPLSSDGPMLSDGDVIPRAATTLPVEFQELLRSLDGVLGDIPPGRTRRLVQNLAAGVGGRGEEIATVLESLGTLSEAFASVAPEQQRLLENATTAGSEFLRTKEEFAAAMRAADQVLAGLGDEPEELRALFASNDRFARAASALLAKSRGDLAGGIRALADFVNFQLREKEGLLQSLEHIPEFLHAVEDSSIPWESPDGRRFYRIRVGLVTDNVPSSWPCKYKLPEDYERMPHVRESKRLVTTGQCEPPAEGSTEAAALITALREWTAADPAGLAASLAPSEGAVGEPAPGLIWPLDGAITSYFGLRDGRMHEGIDIDGVAGDPVVAAAGGTVIESTYHEGYGNMVVTDHGDGWATLYAHLSSQAVIAGQTVGAGELVGAVGCTGSCTGDHLHFELWANGSAVDPLPHLPGGALWTAGAGTATPEPAPEETTAGDSSVTEDSEGRRVTLGGPGSTYVQ